MNAPRDPIDPIDPINPVDAVDAQDQARADLYALLAALLLQPPAQSLLTALANDSGRTIAGDGALAAAWQRLGQASAATTTAVVASEFDALFIGVGTPQVNPYGSHYLAGFMMEKPLAALRDDLHALGLGRRQSCRELEDHLGATCEAMRLLIAGSLDQAGRDIASQRTFFLKHLSPWYARCCDDIRRARGASYYLCVADFAQAFFDVEFEAFAVEDDWVDAPAAPAFTTKDLYG